MWQRSDLLKEAAPSLLVLLLFLLASRLPLPLGGISLPVMPLIAGVYYWSLFMPGILPLGVIALFSLPHDVLYGLPLGASLLALLAVRALSQAIRRRLLMKQFLVAWLAYLPVLALALFVLGIVGEIVTPSDPLARLRAWVPVFLFNWCCYPLLHLLFNSVYAPLSGGRYREL